MVRSSLLVIEADPRSGVFLLKRTLNLPILLAGGAQSFKIESFPFRSQGIALIVGGLLCPVYKHV